jgi:hypothetical protein
MSRTGVPFNVLNPNLRMSLGGAKFELEKGHVARRMSTLPSADRRQTMSSVGSERRTSGGRYDWREGIQK